MIATFNTLSVLELENVGYRHSLQGRHRLSPSRLQLGDIGFAGRDSRLRAALARKLARQLAEAVSDANIAHGGTLDVRE